jgi:glutamyl-tRNA reductase
MTVLVVGLSHRSAPVHVLERAAVGATEVPKLLEELLRGQHVSEAVLLSTCNRIEVVAVVDAFHGGLADVSAVLARHAGMSLTELTEHVFVHYAGSAVAYAVRSWPRIWASPTTIESRPAATANRCCTAEPA